MKIKYERTDFNCLNHLNSRSKKKSINKLIYSRERERERDREIARGERTFLLSAHLCDENRWHSDVGVGVCIKYECFCVFAYVGEVTTLDHSSLAQAKWKSIF